MNYRVACAIWEFAQRQLNGSTIIKNRTIFGGARPYRPSNGSEGDYFIADWCARCLKYRTDDERDESECDILTRSFWYDLGDKEYPTEWIVDDDGLSNPRCTAFESKP